MFAFVHSKQTLAELVHLGFPEESVVNISRQLLRAQSSIFDTELFGILVQEIRDHSTQFGASRLSENDFLVPLMSGTFLSAQLVPQVGISHILRVSSILTAQCVRLLTQRYILRVSATM